MNNGRDDKNLQGKNSAETSNRKGYERLDTELKDWKDNLRTSMDKSMADKLRERAKLRERTQRDARSTPEPELIEINLNLPNQNEDNGVTVKDIVTIFRQGSALIFTATLISVVAGMVAALIYYFVAPENAGTVTGIISFNYKGAEYGLDPHGRTLDVAKIRSPYVLDRALAELDLAERGVTVEDIRQNVSIGEIIPEDAMERILIIKEIATKDPSKLEQLNDLTYIATQYAITLNIPREFSFLKGAKGTELLTAVFRSYQDYFFEEYGERDILNTAVASLPYSEYDYYEAYQVLSAQMTTVINYLSVKKSEAPDFRANSTQMSFGDIITNVSLLKTIDLAKIRSLIEVRLVTKDKELLISSYMAQIVDKTLERNVQVEKARITQESANSYQKDAAVMFGAGGTQDSALQFTQPSDTYDSLIRQAAEASEEAIRLQGEIEYYENRIVEMQNPDAIYNRSADITLVEAAIESVSEKIALWIEIINETVDEYMEVQALKNATKVVLSPQYTSSFICSAKIMVVIVFAVIFMGFMFSTIFVYLKSMMKD